MAGDIYCIIVTYNAELWLKKCLGSVLGSSAECRIVVVDNHSSDGTVQSISSNYPQVHLIRNIKNLGFGKANNIGIQWALDNGAGYFFLLNQDAWVEPDTIGKLVAAHKKYPEFGVLSPVHYFNQTTLDSKFKSYIRGNEDKIENPSGNQNNRPLEIRFVNAALWLVSRDCIEKNGLFSPIFHHYAEDLNFIHRCRFRQIKIGVCPQAKAFHERGQEPPREKHVPLKKMAARDESYCLGILLNISHGFIRQLLYLFMNTLKELIKLIVTLRFKKTVILFVRIKMVARIPDLWRERLKMKQPGYSLNQSYKGGVA